MAVLNYLLFVSIMNLCAGFICGWIVMRKGEAALPTQRLPRPEPLALLNPSAAPAGPSAAANHSRQPAPTSKIPAVAHDQPATAVLSLDLIWSCFEEELAQVRQRAGYAKSINDKRLGGEVARQLHDCVGAWLFQLQQCLGQSETDPAQRRIEPAVQSQVEMFLSQLESTQTNLASLDQVEHTESFFEQLDHQISMLKTYKERAMNLDAVAKTAQAPAKAPARRKGTTG